MRWEFGNHKRWAARALGLSGLLAALMAVNTAPALASCHHFSVAAAPSSVAEGGKVIVTVSRDGNAASSSIDLSTIDETAKAGTDYIPIHKTVAFTTELQKQYTLSTLDDHGTESSQTFRLHLSNPSGCAVYPYYMVDPDVRVTIKDTNPMPTPTPTHTSPKPTATATVKPTVVPASPTPTSSVKPSARASKTVKTSQLPTISPSSSPSRVVAAGSSKSGTAGALVGVAAALLVVVGVGTFVLRRRRTNP